MPDTFKAEVAAGSHGIEQLAQYFAETSGIATRLLYDTGKYHVWQKTGVFSKETEDNAVKEVGDNGRVKTALAQSGGDFRKVPGGILGDGGTSAAGSESLGIMKHSAQDFDIAGLAQTFQRYVVGSGYGAGEVGVNNDTVKVADNQQRRAFQGVTVAQKLVIGFGKVLVLSLVFPAREAPFPYIGETVTTPVFSRAFFKAERRASGVGGGRGRVVKDVAEVDEVLLRGGPFFQFDLSPLRYEL